MKHLRRVFAAAVMTSALALPTFAGDIGIGRSATGDIGVGHTLAGDIGVGIAEAGEGSDSQSSSSDLIILVMLNNLQNTLLLF